MAAAASADEGGRVVEDGVEVGVVGWLRPLLMGASVGEGSSTRRCFASSWGEEGLEGLPCR